jgi:lysyl-tRNA synthetase class II
MREDWEIFLRSCLEGLSLKILDEDKVFIREHPKRTSRSKKFWIATYKVYEDYKDKVPEEYIPYFSLSCGRNRYEVWRAKAWLGALHTCDF